MFLLLLPATSEADIQGTDVLFPPLYEVFWSAVIALLLWLVLGRALPKIYQMIDKRRDEINQGLDAASKAQEDAAIAKRERAELLAQAAKDAKEIRDEADRDAKKTVQQAQIDATAEAHRITENARAQIDAERQAAMISLRQDVGGLATELAEKIVGEQLKDKALSSRVIDRFIDELEADMDKTPTGVNA